MSVERVEHQGKVIALIVNGQFEQEGVNFFTGGDNPLQLGVINRRAGETIQPHIHRNQELSVKGIQEVLHIDRGRVAVDFYTEDGDSIGNRTLNRGDTILLMGCGHGLRILEDSRVIEVKQGPYDEANTTKIETGQG